jgi:C4-dicarboxylate-specific signal transduction histidine kinase
LTASLAHEINQPIAAAAASAMACVQWLRRETPDIAEASEVASKIARQLRRASDIIERVRLLYQGDTAKREPVNVNESLIEERSVPICRPVFTNPAHLDEKPAYRTNNPSRAFSIDDKSQVSYQ